MCVFVCVGDGGAVVRGHSCHCDLKNWLLVNQNSLRAPPATLPSGGK